MTRSTWGLKRMQISTSSFQGGSPKKVLKKKRRGWEGLGGGPLSTKLSALKKRWTRLCRRLYLQERWRSEDVGAHVPVLLLLGLPVAALVHAGRLARVLGCPSHQPHPGKALAPPEEPLLTFLEKTISISFQPRRLVNIFSTTLSRQLSKCAFLPQMCPGKSPFF